jgi:hypothetical protein
MLDISYSSLATMPAAVQWTCCNPRSRGAGRLQRSAAVQPWRHQAKADGEQRRCLACAIAWKAPPTVPGQWQRGHTSTTGVSAPSRELLCSAQAPRAPEAGEASSAPDLIEPTGPRRQDPANGGCTQERSSCDDNEVSRPPLLSSARHPSPAATADEGRPACARAATSANSPGGAYDGGGCLQAAAVGAQGVSGSTGAERMEQPQPGSHGGGERRTATALAGAGRGPDTAAHMAHEPRSLSHASRRWLLAAAGGSGLPLLRHAQRRERAAPRPHLCRHPAVVPPLTPPSDPLPTPSDLWEERAAAAGRVRNRSSLCRPDD